MKKKVNKYMHKELATIKDGENISGFVVYDGASTSIIDVEEMKNIAAAGCMDTLDYKNGNFIPIVQGNTAKKLRRKVAYNKIIDNMTFEDYVAMDCIFRKQDVDLMLRCDDIILANVCLALESRIADQSIWQLTMAFYSNRPQNISHLTNVLSTYKPGLRAVRHAHNYGSFIMLNLPLSNSKSDFDLLSFQQNTGFNFIYNLDIMGTMDMRIECMRQTVPFFTKKVLDMTRPTSKGLAGLTSVIREADRISSLALSSRGIDYHY